MLSFGRRGSGKLDQAHAEQVFEDLGARSRLLRQAEHEAQRTLPIDQQQHRAMPLADPFHAVTQFLAAEICLGGNDERCS